MDLQVKWQQLLKLKTTELTWQGMGEKIQMLKHLFEFTKSLEDHQQGHNVKQKEGCHHLGVVLTPSSVHFQADSDMR